MSRARGAGARRVCVPKDTSGNVTRSEGACGAETAVRAWPADLCVTRTRLLGQGPTHVPGVPARGPARTRSRLSPPGGSLGTGAPSSGLTPSSSCRRRGRRLRRRQRPRAPGAPGGRPHAPEEVGHSGVSHPQGRRLARQFSRRSRRRRPFRAGSALPGPVAPRRVTPRWAAPLGGGRRSLGSSCDPGAPCPGLSP